MAAPFLLSNRLTLEFEAKTFQDFEEKYNKLCKIAGGGILNEYIRKSSNKYLITFYYPTLKSLNSAKIRFESIKDQLKTSEV